MDFTQAESCGKCTPCRVGTRRILEMLEKICNGKGEEGDIEKLEADIWRDLQPDFRTSHYLDGFAHADKKFHFKVDWGKVPVGVGGLMGAWDKMPSLPDHWTIIEEADAQHPFRLATSPSRSFLNTSFNETPSSQAREGAPTVMIHPDDAVALSIAVASASPARSLLRK